MDIREEKKLERVRETTLLRRVWSFVRPYQKLFWISVILMPLNTIFALTQPYLIKLTIDIFLDPRHRRPAPGWLRPVVSATGGHGLVAMGLLYAAMLLGEFATFYGQFYLTMMVAQYSMSDLRTALFKHVEHLPMAFFDRTPVGRLVSRMTTDIDAISEMVNAGSLTIFNDALTLVTIVAIMFSLNVRLALWTLCAIPPLLVFVNFFRVRARVVYRQIRERLAALNAYLSESLAGMAVIQLFTRERESCREFDQLNLRARESLMLANIYEAGLFSSVEALSAITIGIILWAGGGSVIRNLIGLGTLVAFMDYTQKFFNPLREMSQKYTVIQSAMAAMERIEDLLEEREVISPPRPVRIADRSGSIVFENVDFAYRPGEPVLRNLSLRVERGQKVAIVGATGSGKSTIIKLLTRFYDVNAGRILVDGVDVREWDLTELRRTIGLVQQEVFLFAGDITENIRLGRAEMTEAEVEAALKRAQAWHFVERMPAALREEVRERGANFSSGQRQLLSFARALAYDPRILVMDEATSNVDSETEHLVQLALEQLLTGRTALVIAHRLSTIQSADRIVVLNNGILRESGTHSELLDQRGLYYRLFELQYGALQTAE